MTLKQAIHTSLMIHAITFILMGGFPKGCSRGGDGDSDQQKQEQQSKHEHEKNEEIIDKPIEQVADITIIEETKEEFEMRIERMRRKEIAECTPFFGGIGIVYADRSGLIGKVYKYYPASDAGLQVGDVILSPGINGIKGEIGTPVAITYQRNGVIHNVTIIRGRICTRDMP